MAVFTSVQANSIASSGSVTSLAVTLGSGITQGNLLAACFGFNSTATTITPPDGSWAQAGPTEAAGSTFPTGSLWYLAVDAAHAGQTSFTWTISTAHAAMLTIREWNSSAGWASSPLDAAGGQTTTVAATAMPSGTTSTSTVQASELAVAIFGWHFVTGDTDTGLTAGWTQGNLVQGATTTTAIREAYSSLTAAGTQQASETLSTARINVGVIATFLPAAQAPGAVPQQALSLLRPMRTQVPQQAAAAAPPPPLPAPSQALNLLQQGLPQAPQSPQVPPAAPPGPAPAQSPALLARGQVTQPPSPAVPGVPPPGPAPQQAGSLLSQGLPQSAPSPQVTPAPPPGQQPQNAGNLLGQGLPQAPQYSQLPGPPPPITQPEQSPVLVQRGTATPGHFAQAAAVVVVVPPAPAGAGQQGTSLLYLALPQQQGAALQPAPPPPAPAPAQSPVLLQRGQPVPGHFAQAPAVAPPVITLPGQQQSVSLLLAGRPVPGHSGQATLVVVVPAAPAQAQPQALSLLRLGLPWAAAPPAGPAFTIGALTTADAAGAVLTAASASSTLTAATAPASMLTATDQRTGGPG